LSNFRADLEIEKIFELISNFCVTPYGKDYFYKNIVPIKDYNILKRETIISQDVFDIYKSGREFELYGLADIREILGKLKQGSFLEPIEFRKIANFLNHLNAAFPKNEEFYTERLLMILQSIVLHKEYVDKVYKTVSQEGEIMDSASAELSRIRKDLNKTRVLVNSNINALAQKYAKYLAIDKPVIRNSRLCLVVRGEFRGNVPGMLVGKSDSGFSLYIEPEATVELNERIIILCDEEKAEVYRILSELNFTTNKILNSLEKNIEIVSYLDCLIGKARYCIAYKADFFVPASQASAISFVDLKHPLLEQKNAVPLSFILENRGIIITGPNTGGKTVAIKSIGIAFVLTHSALPVTTVGCSIPFVENILTDIGDEQSIAQNLSTFSGHLKNQKDIVSQADGKSIVIIDELGTGTDPIEGAALGNALIKDLLDKGAMIFITSHLSEIKTFSLKEPRLSTASMSFDIDTLKPTYHFMIGVPGASHAIEIAQKMGFAESIITQAKENIDKEYIKHEELFSKLSTVYENVAAEKDELKRERIEVDRLKSQYLVQLEYLKKKELEKADKEIYNLRLKIKSIKSEIESLISMARQDISRNNFSSIKEYQKELSRIGTEIENLEPQEEPSEMIEDLKVGMTVVLPGKEEGIIEQIKSNKAVIKLLNSPVKLTYDLTQIRPSKKGKTESIKDQSFQANPSAKQFFKELDIRGHTVDEAIPEIEQYISELIMYEKQFGYIIHGKGTGKLSQGVWKYLRACRKIKGFRLGKTGEGGSGVTVVEV